MSDQGEGQPDAKLPLLSRAALRAVWLHPHVIEHNELTTEDLEPKLELLVCFLERLRNLGRWPPKRGHMAGLAADLEIHSIEYDGKSVYWTTVERAVRQGMGGSASQVRDTTVYFVCMGCDGPVWVLHAHALSWADYTPLLGAGLKSAIQARVFRRLRDIEGHAQDNGV